MKPTTQVITFRPDGSIDGLQFKGKGIDLRRFGSAKITRTTDILFDEASQKWTIKFLHGTCTGQTAAVWHAQRFECMIELEAMFRPLRSDEPRDTVLAFEEYEQAVAVEVLLLQAARKAGLVDCIAPESPRTSQPMTEVDSTSAAVYA